MELKLEIVIRLTPEQKAWVEGLLERYAKRGKRASGRSRRTGKNSR